jgi:CHAD domain-containing protein
MDNTIKLTDIKGELSRYLSKILVLLKAVPVPDDDSVHKMRVLLKKSRAVIRLIDPQVESEFKHKDMESLKEAARLMSSWRDSSVHRKTLKEFRKTYPGLFEQLKENQPLKRLLQKPESTVAPTPELQLSIAKIEELIKKTAYRFRFQNLQNLNAGLLLKELENTFSIAQHHFLLCRYNPKEAKLHEFRKKTKDLLYQLYFFRPVNMHSVKSIEKKLQEITGSLGKINDIAQLIKALEYKYPDQDNSDAMNVFVMRLKEKQDEYLLKIWPAATKIFLPGRNITNVLGLKVLVI